MRSSSSGTCSNGDSIRGARHGSRWPRGTSVQVIVLCSEGYTSSLAAAAVQDIRVVACDGRDWRISRLARGGTARCATVVRRQVSLDQSRFLTTRGGDSLAGRETARGRRGADRCRGCRLMSKQPVECDGRAHDAVLRLRSARTAIRRTDGRRRRAAPTASRCSPATGSCCTRTASRTAISARTGPTSRCPTPRKGKEVLAAELSDRGPGGALHHHRHPATADQRAALRDPAHAEAARHVSRPELAPVGVAGRPRRDPEQDPRYLGNAIGRWDGDTLVIESTGFQDSAEGNVWLDDNANPISAQATRRRAVDAAGLPPLESGADLHRPGVLHRADRLSAELRPRRARRGADRVLVRMEHAVGRDPPRAGPGTIGANGNRGFGPDNQIVPDLPWARSTTRAGRATGCIGRTSRSRRTSRRSKAKAWSARGTALRRSARRSS